MPRRVFRQQRRDAACKLCEPARRFSKRLCKTSKSSSLCDQLGDLCCRPDALGHRYQVPRRGAAGAEPARDPCKVTHAVELACHLVRQTFILKQRCDASLPLAHSIRIGKRPTQPVPQQALAHRGSAQRRLPAHAASAAGAKKHPEQRALDRARTHRALHLQRTERGRVQHARCIDAPRCAQRGSTGQRPAAIKRWLRLLQVEHRSTRSLPRSARLAEPERIERGNPKRLAQRSLSLRIAKRPHRPGRQGCIKPRGQRLHHRRWPLIEVGGREEHFARPRAREFVTRRIDRCFKHVKCAR